MSAPGATVPYCPPGPTPLPVQGGRPVSSTTWQAAALMSNYLLGHGSEVIPWHRPALSSGIPAGSTLDFRFRTALQAQTVALLWLVNARSLDAAGRPTAITLRAPYGSGTTTTYVANGQRGSRPLQYVQALTSQTTSAQELGIRIAPTTYACDVQIACIALPRGVLAKTTTDYGSDPAGATPRSAIYAGTAGTGLSLGELGRKGAVALTAARRVGHCHLSLPDSSTYAIQVTGASTDLYVATPMLGRKLYRSSTTASVAVEVLAFASASGTTYGTFTATSSHGSAVISLGSLGSELTTTPTWYGPGTLTVDAEDLTEATGLPSATFGTVTFAASLDAGAATIYVASISSYEAP